MQVARDCAQKQVPFFVVTATVEAAQQQLQNSNITFLKCDATVIKTAARVNPTYILMKQANVLAKYANADVDNVLAKVKTINK